MEEHLVKRIGCEQSILFAWGIHYHKDAVAQGLGRIQKKPDIFKASKYTKRYNTLCDYAFLIYTCIHTYVYIHICTWNKYVKSKAWFRTETNLYWLKKALYWNWLFLRRPVVLPVKQLELAVVKNHFTCLSPISSHKKESSWTFIHVPNIWEIPLSCYSPSESAAVPFKTEEPQTCSLW